MSGIYARAVWGAERQAPGKNVIDEVPGIISKIPFLCRDRGGGPEGMAQERAAVLTGHALGTLHAQPQIQKQRGVRRRVRSVQELPRQFDALLLQRLTACLGEQGSRYFKLVLQ